MIFNYLVLSIANNGITIIDKCSFYDNMSFTVAATMYMFNSGAIIIQNSHFERNSA